ncbi:Spy/CpxP family protein refolding chaperone [Falsiroseomonas sp.]|uniref:Spy/CpxP family protein refolding chaperone n=1 Tax=Falsiroseomonas sp. TaxID=2870721 RepID=UPI002722D3A8|nr:Spy/CpxP family protein refolding chaperone [Falsiroseomonas sp.]MDO9499314.1 Spy/CpxP family protein refolding chaperone [Falsiroseomonas sp.]
MRKLSIVTTAAILAFGVAGTALAQAPAPAGAATDPHHPGAPAGAPQAATPPAQHGAPGPGMAGPGAGMMGGDMGRMMQQMMQNRMATASMQPFRRIEGHLAFFRAELRVTDGQMQQWSAFADAVRTQSDRLRQAMQQAMGSSSGTAPEQMERRVALLSAHLEAMRAISAAATPFYAALSEEQRRTADELMAEHLRGMRMGMR